MKALIRTQKPNGWMREPGVFTSPFSLFSEIMNDNFFTSATHDMLTKDFSSHMPAVNISEDENSYFVELSAPGFLKENFKLEVLDGHLVVSAERKQEEKIESKKFSRKEFSCGAFRRSFTLSDNADEEKISAGYDNGILNITIPKKQEAKKTAREIVIG